MTRKWTHILQDAIHAYNHSVHRMIKKRPVDLNADTVDDIRALNAKQQSIVRNRSDIHVGDKVRISKVKSVFAKGYLPNWTEEIFTVTSINTKFSPTTYKLKDYAGDEIEGSFYRYEIEPITQEDDVYMIEKIIRRQRRDGAMWVLVKWQGYSASMNSWVRESDIQRLTQR